MKRAPLLLFLLAAAVYFNCLSNEFTQDDTAYILSNKQILHAPWEVFTEPYGPTYLYRPLGILSYQVNYGAGIEPVWFHLFNLLLHAGVTVLFYFLVRKLLDRPLAALAAALLFAVHPIHTEAVAAAVGRTELLGAGFLLSAWLLHLQDRVWPATLCFLLALLSKESAAAFLALVLLGDSVCKRLRPPATYARYAGAFALFLLLWWNALGSQGFTRIRYGFLENPLVELPPLWRVLNALRVAWKYLALQLFPATLSADYSFNAIPVLRSFGALLPALLATAAVVALWLWSFRRHPGTFLAGSIYLACFAVTANVLFPIGTIMAERLAYLPSAGLCLLAGLGWEWLAGKRKTAAVAGLAVVVSALAARTVVRNRDWHNNFTLYTAAVRAAPEDAKSRRVLGRFFMERRELGKAREQLEIAYRIYPEDPSLQVSLGELYLQTGERGRAEKILQGTVERTGRDYPQYNRAAHLYAAILMGSGRYEEALVTLNHIVAVAPQFSPAYSLRAMARYHLGEWEAARADAETALRLDPENGPAVAVLALLQQQKGKPEN